VTRTEQATRVDGGWVSEGTVECYDETPLAGGGGSDGFETIDPSTGGPAGG
jgi:hypothetical protein